MQTLGISDSTERSESRIKTLFWPSVQDRADVDTLGTQGFWVVFIVGLLSFVLLVFGGQWFPAVVVAILYLVGAAGIRERSRFASVIVFIFFLLDTLIVVIMAAPSVILVARVFFVALLFSNVRATFIAAHWTRRSDDGPPPARFNSTLSDKLADQFPMWLWPKLRVFYYVFAGIVLAFGILGLLAGAAGFQPSTSP